MVKRTEIINVELGEVAGRSNENEVDQIRLSEWIGQRKFSAALQRLLTVSDLIELQKMKESKAYKGLKVIGEDGNPLTVSSFSDVCKSIGGSEQHVNEQLLNLRTFGPEFLEFANRALGFRHMRSLRKLPEDHKTALIEVAKGGSKDDLLELAEELLEKERAAKDELAAQNADLTTRTNVLERELEKTDSEFKRFKDRTARQPGKAVFADRTGFVREEALAYQLEGQLAVDALMKLFQEVVHEPDRDDPEWKARFEMVWIQGQALYARTLLMVEAMREAGGMGFAPLGNHVLTAEEAAAWLADVELITRQQEAHKQQRELAREAAKPRGPGRPAGSGKNKKGAE
jgi:hypothetical protein